jgi:hypothetical protein
MKRIIRFLDQYDQVIGVIIIVLLVFLFLYWKTGAVNNEGIITVAKVLRHEGAESGSELYIEIYLDDKKYITSVGQDCQQDCIGNYFFVKVMRNDPTDYPILYGHAPVPACIITNVKIFKGWSKIPDCSNYSGIQERKPS